MEMQLTEPTQNYSSPITPYPPSFIDRFLRFVQRLSIPFWLTYLLLFALQGLINHVLVWVDGWAPPLAFRTILLTFPLWLWFPLAIITFLNRTASATLDSFRSLMTIDDEALARLKYEFTTMPRRAVLISAVIWITVFLTIVYLSLDLYGSFGFSNSLTLVFILEGVICFGIGGVMYYHSIRQLWLVHRTVRTVKHFNLFNLSPVYAFSRLTAWTGASWMLMLLLTLLIFPLGMAPQVILTFASIQAGLAFAAFILPLRSVHSSLVREKRRLLSELQHRAEPLLVRLHSSVDQNELGGVDQLYNAITALYTEQMLLEKIPTWPWRADTLLAFLSATVLPIVLFLIQEILQEWMAR